MFGSFGGSPGGTASTMLYQGHPPVNLYYRPLQQSDYDALKAIHQELFPIDYEDVFFRKAVAGEDRVFTWAAVHSEYGRDYLVGFVTARVVYLYECDPMDRQVMSLASKCLDGDGTVYVLTLGVVPACRQCGIARSLLGLVHQHASRLRCRAIFLHVISYNDAAMRLYGTSGYQVMARLPNFYHLVTGRQPNPDQSWYDAFLYALFIPSSGPELSPAMQWAGGMLGAAVAPLRSMLGTFNGCIPSWLCRQTYSTFMPFASTTGGGASQGSASKGSLADTATSGWQPPLPHPPLQQQQWAPPSKQSVSHHSRRLQSQQLPLSTCTAPGIVCSAVSAEQFLKRGNQQQYPPAQQQQQQQSRCSVGERRLKDGGHYSQGPAGSSSRSSSGTEQPGSQSQQQCNVASTSYVVDPGAGGSSGASSASVSGDLVKHPGINTISPLPPPPALHPQSKQQQQMYAPILCPPSPPVPPSLSASSTSLQQRHPHNSGSTSPSYVGWGGQRLGHHRSHQPQHPHQGSHGPQFGGVTGNATHGRTGEHTRGGIHRGGPQGFTGGGLSLHPQQQQQPQQSQQQQRGTVLTALFRPPTGQWHPHSR
ncbi:hypothetical protein Vretimale_7887 [Volvox reticuliferus]|uniref:N-alpha-acetyltransferase 60 n=1 Tax=Volvox reticuliferus TaxID=1737510 RepID=A0A8J4FL39_9CHLO|nr:hypothetical protein Vretifemale_5047 [Volvox reticuliferus]GIM03082.1 hypothetical protein Vretimale_7887 [Volvox reticuliferus]